MCRCAERRSAIVAGLQAAAAGDGTRLKAMATFVARSGAEDAAMTARRALAAAHMRLRGARR